MTTYYIADSEYMDAIYGSEYPTCLSAAEVNRLSNEWGIDLLDQMHEASADEIEKWGVTE